MQSTRWLVIAFCILFIIVVGEVIYYFFILTPKQNNSQSTVFQNQNTPGSPNSLSTPVSSPTPFLPPQSTNAVRYINNFKSDSVTSSKFINTYKGKISSIENKTGQHTDQSYNVTITYVSILTLVSENNPTIASTWYFTESDLKKMAVFQKENNTEKKITYSDLKSNDIITIDETMDALKTDIGEVFSYKITKE